MEIKPTTEHAVEELSFREAILPPSLQNLRQKLGQKAKQQKWYRFYSLYALVSRSDVLQAAFAAVRRNEGAPGVDGGNLHVRFDEGEDLLRKLTIAVGLTPAWTPLYSTG